MSQPTTLILIPSAEEFQWLANHSVAREPMQGSAVLYRRCGVGLLVSAMLTSQLIEECRPDRVILTGIAGTFDTQRLPIGQARSFDQVSQFGFGVGQGEHHGPWHLTDLTRFEEMPGSIDLWQPEAGLVPARLISVAAASSSIVESQLVREVYPDAMAEDMEAYSVALLCRMRSIPCAVIRGISNAVGDRTNWNIPAALKSVEAFLNNLIENVLEMD